MRNAYLLLVVVCMAGIVSAQSQAAPAKIGASAVWQVSPQFLATAHAACDKSHPGDVDCMIDQMAKAGAPADAVSFTRELYKQSHGELGVVTGFQSQPPVGWRVDHLSSSCQHELRSFIREWKAPHPQCRGFEAARYKNYGAKLPVPGCEKSIPNVNLWPGDRDGKTWPNSQSGPNGGTQFVVGYPLRNGCHACASAGSALFTWNFDAQGKFQGTTFMGLTPPPLQ